MYGWCQTTSPSVHARANSRSAPECQVGEDEIFEFCVLDPVLDVISELVVPHPCSMKVLSTFKSVGIKLHLEHGVNLIKKEV